MDVNLESNSIHMLFPVSGGPMRDSGLVGKHTNTPIVSPNKVTFKSCGISFHLIVIIR